jgi:antitoxin (DNA-binding transcriptional repressor) of toxin-antitoxin stability system
MAEAPDSAADATDIVVSATVAARSVTKLLAAVREGRHVTITYRGKVAAVLDPPSGSRSHSAYERSPEA